ncbi:hypothetical protein POF50_032575 [Streptomyces sp. SL13]|uniref:Uncharacterized protein n=1 Tax=Streptantibioticus silvisoli TaxID=2705255 RepID=A0AA90HA20_9ACTN|nr:hypothetical protein [Streptantibioticus silvisoli]MDI5974026.1 hypothetical protein [Streptantibioticus silvisoli]
MAFVVVCVAGLFLCTGLVLDGGLVLAGKVDAEDEAQEAARVGSQHVDLVRLRDSRDVRLDGPQAEQAALTYVRSVGDTGRARAGGDTVTVTVTHRQTMQILSLLGIHDLVATATATARAEQGVSGPFAGSR